MAELTEYEKVELSHLRKLITMLRDDIEVFGAAVQDNIRLNNYQKRVKELEAKKDAWE